MARMSLAFALFRLPKRKSVPFGLEWMVYHHIKCDFKSAGEILAPGETRRTRNTQGAPLTSHVLNFVGAFTSPVLLSLVKNETICNFARVTQNVETCSGTLKPSSGRLQ